MPLWAVVLCVMLRFRLSLLSTCGSLRSKRVGIPGSILTRPVSLPPTAVSLSLILCPTRNVRLVPSGPSQTTTTSLRSVAVAPGFPHFLTGTLLLGPSLTTAPPLSTLTDHRCLEWVLYLIQERRLRSIVVAPPAGSFSCAWRPPLRSWSSPGGFSFTPPLLCWSPCGTLPFGFGSRPLSRAASRPCLSLLTFHVHMVLPGSFPNTFEVCQPA